MSTAATLTSRQARFIDEFLVDGNGTQAAVRAGYEPSGARLQAYRLLNTNEAVSRAVAARRASDATRLSIQRDDVLAAFLEAAQQARKLKQPMALIAAAREIGKLLGFYAPAQVKVDVGDVGAGDFAAMSDSELLRIIEASRAHT